MDSKKPIFRVIIGGKNKEQSKILPIVRSDDEMEWQEKYIDKLNQDVSDIKSDMRAMRQELKTEIREMRQEINATLDRALTEMRDRDNQRHQEILTMQTKIDENVAGLKTEISSTNKWVIGLVVTTIIGIVTIAGTVISFVISH